MNCRGHISVEMGLEIAGVPHKKGSVSALTGDKTAAQAAKAV